MTQPTTLENAPNLPLPAPREGGGSLWMVPVYAGLHLSLLGLFWTGLTLIEALALFVLMQLRGFCVSAGYHRLLAHRSYRTSRWFQFLLSFGACTALRGGPLYWAAAHRRHHRVSDTEADIFRPDDGFWWTYCGWLLSGRFDRTDYTAVRDLARLPELRWLNRWWLLPALMLAATIYLIAGWWGVLTVFCTSTVALLHQMALVDVANHQFGSQRYDTHDQSRNSMIVSLLAGGEGWHNNHHHYPASAQLGFYWWEADGTWTGLQILAWLGLVHDLRTPPETILQRTLSGAPSSDNPLPPGE